MTRGGIIIGVETEYAVAEAGAASASAAPSDPAPSLAESHLAGISRSGGIPEPSPRSHARPANSPRPESGPPTPGSCESGLSRRSGLGTNERLAELARVLGRSPADDAHHRTLAHNASAVVNEVTASLPHLPAERAGAFLANGARCYVDCYKAEYATPETRSPADAVCHILAGRAKLDAAARRCNEQSKHGAQLRIFAQHVDYDPNGAHTWAVHENYAPPVGIAADEVRRALAPHLASRTVFGAGGFSSDPDQPLAFVRSPRALLLCRGAACAGEVGDPMFHARGPVGWGPQRVHLLCCESLRSHVGSYLTLGTTALILHLAAKRIACGSDFLPVSPRQALARFAADATDRTRVRCTVGGQRSALEIQQHLCELAHRARDIGATEDLPWADELLATWDWFLTDYARRGREAFGRSIDWAIKFDLFAAHCLASSHGTMTVERLLEWNRPLAWIVRQLPALRNSLADPAQLPREIASTPPPALGARMIRVWERAGLLWEQLPTVLRLRLELRELDWRYAQIGDGIFDGLEGAGVLRHAAPGVTLEAIDRASREPPADTRARVRGATIVAWAGKRRHAAARCEWNRVTDPGTQEIVNLPDPFDAADVQPQRWEMSRDGAVALFDRAISLYRTSRFAAAWRLLGRVRAANPWPDGNPREENSQPFRLLRYTAWVAARLGRTDAVDYLRAIHGETIDASSMLKVADHLYCYRFMGLAPHAKTAEWLGAAEELMRRDPPADEPLAAAVREHVGAWHLHHGRLDRVENAIGPAAREDCTWRRARIHALLTELYRRRGEDDRAHRTLAAVAGQIPASTFEVLVAEQITPMQARLATQPGERKRLYDQAARVLLRARHPMALARVLVLRARDGDCAAATTIRSRLDRLARVAVSLGQCELTRSLLARWDEWCSAACGQNLL